MNAFIVAAAAGLLVSACGSDTPVAPAPPPVQGPALPQAQPPTPPKPPTPPGVQSTWGGYDTIQSCEASGELLTRHGCSYAFSTLFTLDLTQTGSSFTGQLYIGTIACHGCTLALSGSISPSGVLSASGSGSSSNNLPDAELGVVIWNAQINGTKMDGSFAYDVYISGGRMHVQGIFSTTRAH
jgi:hypothetical protein